MHIKIPRIIEPAWVYLDKFGNLRVPAPSTPRLIQDGPSRHYNMAEGRRVPTGLRHGHRHRETFARPKSCPASRVGCDYGPGGRGVAVKLLTVQSRGPGSVRI